MSDSQLTSPSLLMVVEQLKHGRNAMPLVLAETIIGLDDRAISRAHAYTGCPRLLQVWLMERLRCLSDPTGKYGIGSVTSRRLTWPDARRRPVGYFVDFVRFAVPRWIVPWWEVSECSGSDVLTASQGLMLCGFDLGIHIHPLRVRRQMGFAQTIPAMDTKIQEPVVLSRSILERWELMWANRSIWKSPVIHETVWVSGAYIRWTKSDDPKANEGFRKDEKVDGLYRQRKAQVDDQPKERPDVVRPSSALVLGKRKLENEGTPLSGGVFKRLGEASSSRIAIPTADNSVFGRLGNKRPALERIEDRRPLVESPMVTVVLGLEAPKPKLKSKIVKKARK